MSEQQTINIRLPNGKTVPASFPSDWTQEQVEEAIYHNSDELMKESTENQESIPDKAPQTFGQKLLRYGVQDPVAGLAQLGHGVINTPHNLASLFSEKLASKIPHMDDFDYSSAMGIPEEEKNLADRAIQFAPEMAVAMVLPAAPVARLAGSAGKIPALGNYLQKALQNRYAASALGNGLTQGTFAASQSDRNQGESFLEAGGVAAPFAAISEAALSGNPMARKLARGLMATGGAFLGYEGAKSAGADNTVSGITAALMSMAMGRGGNAKQRASEKMLKGVEGADYKNTLEAADRLGLSYLTPAEASGNPFVGAAQGKIGNTEQGAQLLFKKGEQRAASEQQAINKFLDAIYSGALEPEKAALYKMAGSRVISSPEMDALKKNEIFREAQKIVNRDPAYREAIKGIDSNSVAYLDFLKQAMDGMIESGAKGEGSRKLVRDFKNSLISAIDKQVPEYRQARGIAERAIARKKVEDMFNRKPMTGTNFGKFLEDNAKYKRLHHSLRNTPAAQKQLEDMRLVFRRLIDIPTARKAEALERRNSAKSHNMYQDAMGMFREMLSSGKHDTVAVDLITNPKWADELKRLGQVSGKENLLEEFQGFFQGQVLRELVRKNTHPWSLNWLQGKNTDW